MTNEENQLELARLTNVIAVNKKALNDRFYTNYDQDDLMAKARVLSAKQLTKIQPVMHQARNQKEINTIINSAVQEILLGKQDTKTILDRVAKDWQNQQ